MWQQCFVFVYVCVCVCAKLKEKPKAITTNKILNQDFQTRGVIIENYNKIKKKAQQHKLRTKNIHLIHTFVHTQKFTLAKQKEKIATRNVDDEKPQHNITKIAIITHTLTHTYSHL